MEYETNQEKYFALTQGLKEEFVFDPEEYGWGYPESQNNALTEIIIRFIQGFQRRMQFTPSRADNM